MGSGKLDDEMELDTAGGYVPPKRSTLIVDTEGGQAPISQGDMSDAQFAALTKQTAEAGKLVAVEHPDGSRTDGKSLVESFGKGRPIIGPDGSLIQTGGDNQTNLPAISGAQGGSGQSAETAAAEKAMHERYARENPGRSVPNQFGDALANSVVGGFGMKGVFDALAPAARYIADAYTPQPVVDPGIQGPAPGVDPGQPHALDFGAPPVPPQVGGSVSVKGSIPGAGDPVPPNINLAPGDYGLREAKTAMEMQQQAAKDKAAAEATYYDEAALNHYRTAQKIVDYDNARLKVEANMAEDHQRTQAAFARLDQQIEDASHAKVDTRRYFSNLDAGQKAAAALAGAFFGLAGQGMQWLQHVKSLVDQDIDAQKTDFENAFKGLQLKRENLKDMYSMARQAGLDGLAAVEHAKASMFQKMALDLQFWSDDANSAIAKSNGQAMAGQLLGKYAEHKSNASAHADSMRVHKAQMEMKLYELQLHDKWNEDKLALQAVLKGTAKPLPMTDKEEADFADLKSGADQVLELKKAYREARDDAKGDPSWQVTGYAKKLLPDAASASNRYENVTRKALGIEAGTKLLGKKGMDRLEEQDRYLNNEVPSVLEADATAEAKLQHMDTAALRNYTNRYEMFKVKNPVKAAELMTPEQFAAELKKHSRVEDVLPAGVTRGSSRAR